MKEKLFKIFKTLLMFLLFFSISSIPIIIFNIDIKKLSEIEKIVYGFCCNILFLIIIAFTYRKTLIKDFKPYFKNFSKNLEDSLKIYLIGLGIMIVSNLIIAFVLNGNVAENEALVRKSIELAPLLMIIEVSIYAPLTEELLFRKSIRDVIKNKYLYIFVSGFIFGLLHVLSSNTLLEYLYLIPYCSLGFTFAYIYSKSDNIYSTIMLHAVHNTITIMLLFLGASL